MFPLFELSRLLSFGSDFRSKSDAVPQLVHSAWKEVGEKSFLALLFSNGYLVLHYSIHGCRPIVKQLPWSPSKPIQALCFDPTGSWLLCITAQDMHYIMPALALLDPQATLNHTWRVDDVSKVKGFKRKGVPTCAIWWQTFDGENIGIIGTKHGNVQFLDLQLGKVMYETNVGEHIVNLDLVQDDSLSLTYALITTKSNSQWKLVLESKACDQTWPPDEDLAELGFEEVDSRNLPIYKITQQQGSGDSGGPDFNAIRFYQFSPTVLLSPQFAKGRHFIAAHDLTSSLYMVYDTTIEHSPLYIYKVPERSENVMLTDKLLFYTSNAEAEGQGSQLITIAANQLAEAVVENVQEFNPEAVVQEFELPQEERIVAVFKRTYPFYWHEKRQDEMLSKKSDQSDSSSVDSDSLGGSHQIRVTSHTVLDGCIIITNQCIYECRPRISPEQLFLRYVFERNECASAEQLAIILSLDINALYEQVAKHQLSMGDVNQASRFFQLAKCPPQKRVAAFAKAGQIPEVLTYVQQTLNSKVHELSDGQRCDLSELALYCYIQQVLVAKEPNIQSQEALSQFLSSNHHYDEQMAIELLAEFRLTRLLMDLAKSHGLIAQALEALFSQTDQGQGVEFFQTLAQKGYVTQLEHLIDGGLLRYITAKDLVAILQTKPEVKRPLLTALHNALPKMSEETLQQMAALFDPSDATFYGLLAKLKARSTNYDRSLSSMSMVSVSSRSTMATELLDMEPQRDVLIDDLLTVFIESVLRLNQLRGQGVHGMTEASTELPSSRSPEYVVSCQPQPVSCGPDHTAFVSNGDVYTCGLTKRGRLGIGESTEATVWLPVRVESLCKVTAISVSCGTSHTMALTETGLYGWGWSQFGQVGVAGNELYTRPVFVEGLAGMPCVQVSCGAYHTLALTRKGSVYSWGWGVHGQLGHGNIENLSQPTLVAEAETLRVIRLASGYAHSVLLTNQGDVLTFGCNAFGQLGIGSTVKSSLPVQVCLLPGPVKTVATKYFHNLALTEEGKLFMWGGNPHMLRSTAHSQRKAKSAGQQQRAPAVLTHHLVPNIIDTGMLDASIAQVYCGGNFCVVITVDHEVYTWGKNLDGQLGLGHRIEQRDPQMVMRINDRKVIHLSCGAENVVAMDDEEELWAWGRNSKGQLGMKNPEAKPQRKAVQYGPQFLQVSKGAAKTTDVVLPVKMEAAPQPKLEDRKNSQTNVDEWSWSFQLPDLHTLTPPYPRHCLRVVLQYLGRYVDTERALQLCIEIQDWQAAIWLCIHQQQYPLAFHYHLKMAAPEVPTAEIKPNVPDSVHVASVTDSQSITQTESAMDGSGNQEGADAKHLIKTASESNSTSNDTLACYAKDIKTADSAVDMNSSCSDVNLNGVADNETELQSGAEARDESLQVSVVAIAETYFRKVNEQEIEGDLKSVNIRYFLCELCVFWQEHKLPVIELERFLREHLATIAVQLYGMIDRNTSDSDQSKKRYNIPLDLWKRFSTKFQLELVACVTKEIKNNPGPPQPLSELFHPNANKPPKSQDVPKLSVDKLWQDILQNLRKDIGIRDCITLSTSEIDALRWAVQKSSLDDDNTENYELQQPNAVLFTCGHHFTKENFMLTVVPGVEEKLKNSKLPQTSSVLSAYYGREGGHPLACPNCALQAIAAV